MSRNRPECPKCGGSMDEGFVLDHDLGASTQERWGQGKPERSFFEGTVPSSRKLYPVTTYRCGRCGFLESYARPEVESR